MCSMHTGLHRACVKLAHNTSVTMKAVYSLRYHMPAPPCVVARRIQHWPPRRHTNTVYRCTLLDEDV